MITRVEIKNYRSIAHADVTMGPLTVLVGRNGSGKSSFVDALKFVRDALQTNLENAVNQRGGFESIRRWGTPDDENVEIAIEVESEFIEERYEFALRYKGKGIYVKKEKATHRAFTSSNNSTSARDVVNEHEVELEDQRWISNPLAETANIDLSKFPSPDPNALVLQSISFGMGFMEIRRATNGNFTVLHPDALRKSQTSTDTYLLSDNADNFLSFLRNLIKDESTKTSIVNALDHITNGIEDLRVNEGGGYLFAELQHGDLENEPWFALAKESDGTVRMLGLLTALYEAESQNLLALQEPENDLHPGALAILSDEIKSASRRRQLLITTQSPDLIARFPVADLRVVERRGGVTHIAPLDETQRQVIEDQLFDAGELLRSEGLRGAGGF